MGSFIIKKYHGLGNDYLVIDPNKSDVDLKETHIKKLCKRNFGIGADGILYGPIIEDGKMLVRCFNPDASEATNTGTGIRIFAKYLKDEGYTKEDQVDFYTVSGKTSVEFLNQEGTLVRAKLEPADFRASAIPVVGEEREVINEGMYIGGQSCEVTCVSVGNPHCGIFSNDVNYKKVMEMGPMVEHSEYFPNGINFMLMHVDAEDKISIEVFERGAGYTLASGTSACAAAAICVRLGLTNRKVTVCQPGGELEVEIDDDNQIIMTGSVADVGMMMLTDSFFS